MVTYKRESVTGATTGSPVVRLNKENKELTFRCLSDHWEQIRYHYFDGVGYAPLSEDPNDVYNRLRRMHMARATREGVSMMDYKPDVRLSPRYYMPVQMDNADGPGKWFQASGMVVKHFEAYYRKTGTLKGVWWDLTLLSTQPWQVGLQKGNTVRDKTVDPTVPDLDPILDADYQRNLTAAEDAIIQMESEVVQEPDSPF